MAKRDKKKIRVLLCGNGVNIAEMNMALYGVMDPDIEMLRGVSREMFEAAYPKIRRGNPFGIPIIYGTGGGLSGKFPYLKDSGAEATVFDLNGDKHWSDPSLTVSEPMVGWIERYNKWLAEHPPMDYDDPISEERVKDIIDKLSKR